ncbi:ATP-binding protein [Paenibacillus silviterrae]|uniref:ATP-binding protein n=1 Tax=Paenibacillus silviterrae TaxID=3242194 RepID=UPI0025431C43|nr:AAA family ATPase [Paenibacillus chinjuensis]
MASNEATRTLTAYKGSWDFYADAGELLDLRILLAMRRMEGINGPSDPALEPFKGLVLTPEEMYRLLSPDSGKDADPELSQLARLVAEAEARMAQRISLTRAQDVFIPLLYLADVFELDSFELQVVYMLLAAELDRKYDKLYAYIQDDANCKYATPDLCAQLSGGPFEPKRSVTGYFVSGGKLRTWLLQPAATGSLHSLLALPLKLDERILAFLLGIGLEDKKLSGLVKLYSLSEEPPALETGQELQSKLRQYVETGEQQKVVFCLWGAQGAGKKLQARHVAYGLSQTLLVVDIAALNRHERAAEELLLRIRREAKLHGALLAWDRFHLLQGDAEATTGKKQAVLDVIRQEASPSFLLSAEPWNPLPWQEGMLFLEEEIPYPDTSERMRLWHTFSKERGMENAADWASLAGKFRLHPGQITGALDYARQLIDWERLPAADDRLIHKACYAFMQHNLKRKAVRIEARYTWDRVVLPPEQKEQLEHACARLKYRQLVYGEWGFDRALAYGKGTSLLFAGPPGTGKTMSAQVIASELNLELYRIDLSQVISKYIGETEKNLHEIFQEAGQSGAILFFDEADALFGKRSEVKDAQDKYANVETAYLLQKMEEYEGITILATNLLHNLDEAFMRRFGFIVKFPFPDIDHRELLWQSIFPPQVPLEPDIDYRFLASRFEMAGGIIKNVAVSAAFLAAGADKEVGMKEILTAVRSEMRKNGKLLLPADLGEYAELLKD